ncbi:MAG: hypothetical protein MO847_00315 [Candidatus Protistobacter heckmanni]|nr:hypothetical protein [Candidatus Protistobacter heckmanni]
MYTDSPACCSTASGALFSMHSAGWRRMRACASAACMNASRVMFPARQDRASAAIRPGLPNTVTPRIMSCAPFQRRR